MSSASDAGPPAVVVVGIALIRRDDSFLVRPRPQGAPLPGLWEFPGGKCEPGETPEQAAVRECAEETGLAVTIVRLRGQSEHAYAHARVGLYYYDCETTGTATNPDPSTGFRWVAARVLPSLPFPAANDAIVAALADE